MENLKINRMNGNYFIQINANSDENRKLEKLPLRHNLSSSTESVSRNFGEASNFVTDICITSNNILTSVSLQNQIIDIKVIIPLNQ